MSSIVAVPIYIPINSAQVFPFPTSLTTFILSCLLKNSSPDKYEVIAHYGFDLHFPVDCGIKNLYDQEKSTPNILIRKWAKDLNRHFPKRNTNGQQIYEKVIIINNIKCNNAKLREGNDIPLQCSCLENPMDRGAW